MNIKPLLIGLSSLLLLGTAWAQTDTGGETGGLETGSTEMTAPEGETVVDLIASDPELSTL